MRYHTIRPRLLLLAGLAVMLLTLAACGSDSNEDGGAASSSTDTAGTTAVATQGTQTAQQDITVTDIVGRQVTLKAPVKSMILSEGRALYIVAPLDRDDPFARVFGWADDLRINDFGTYEKYREKFPHLTKIPVFGSVAQGAFSVEQAIGVGPDLMVLTYDSYVGAKETDLIKKLESAGIPSIVIDFRQYPLENTVPSIILMGRVMGQEQRAQELADFYTEKVNQVYSRVESIKQTKPNTFLYRAAGLSECCGTFGSANMGLLIERAGGLNLGTKFLPGFNGTLNPEQVIVSNPEVIIVTGSNWKNSKPEGGFVILGYNTSAELAQEQLKSLVQNTPGWDSLAAVQQGRVHAIWHQFYFSPYQFVVLQQFAKWLYLQEFADIDPDATFRVFHQRFLPIDYSGTFWTTIK